MTDSSQTTIEQCEHCHKPIQRKRLSIGFLLKDAFDNLFNLERGLFFTIWRMIIDPRNVVTSFIEGDRYRYMNPFRILLVAATVAVLVEAFIDNAAVFRLFEFQSSDQQAIQMISEVMNNYTNIVILLMVPFYAISTFIVFRKAKWNLAEHLATNAYSLSIVLLLGSAVSLALSPLDLSEETAARIGRLLNLIHFFAAYVFIRTWQYKWWGGLLRFILSFMMANIIAIPAMIGLFILYAQFTQ